MVVVVAMTLIVVVVFNRHLYFDGSPYQPVDHSAVEDEVLRNENGVDDYVVLVAS